MKYTTDNNAIGRRLDVWLAEASGLSRSRIQKLIENSQVLVNGLKTNSHYSLKDNEIIEIIETTERETKNTSDKMLPKDIPIISQTDDYIVINKPAGVLTHGTENDSRGSLADWLVQRMPPIAKVGEDPARPGIVHRLDKDASGLIVVAKNQASFDDLKKQFQERTVTKLYQALVYGDDIGQEGEIRFKMERSTKGYRMAARPLNQEGKLAITEFSVIKRFHNYTLLSVKIKTGRTHQIRASLAAFNHPVVGDDLYGTARQKITNKKFKLGRVFLVAAHLEFTDLKGERQIFEIELPVELKAVLSTLKEKV